MINLETIIDLTVLIATSFYAFKLLYLMGIENKGTTQGDVSILANSKRSLLGQRVLRRA